MRRWSRSMRSQGNVIALVPTMGYLHQGHLSLIQEAHKHAQNLYDYGTDAKVPTGSHSHLGFDGETERKLDSLDKGGGNPSGLFEKLNSSGGGERKVGSFVDRNVVSGKEGGNTTWSFGNLGSDDGKERKVVSCIEEKECGRLGHETWIRVDRLETGLCGKSRPVVFRGVATVVAKLFNIVEPDVAIFGKKDYQQWRIIRRMVRDLDFGINVIGSEIVRDVDGLALSSRNVHLSPKEREKALSIYKSLSKAKTAAQNGEVSCSELRNSVIQAIVEAGGRIDYAEIVDQESLLIVEEIRSPVVFCVAAWFGKVRLIDNMEIDI